MERLCGVVASLNDEDVSTIIDVGAGKGYIAQILDYFYNKVPSPSPPLS